MTTEDIGIKLCNDAARAAGWRNAENGVAWRDSAAADEHSAVVVVKPAPAYVDEDDAEYNLPADDVDAFCRELEARGIARGCISVGKDDVVVLVPTSIAEEAEQDDSSETCEAVIASFGAIYASKK